MDGAALRSWFDGQTAVHAFSGAALAWRDGGPVFRYEGGLAHRADGVPIDRATRFAVASVTKMATAIAALRLVDQGVLSLDGPVVEVLPAALRPAALTPRHTLHHLLSHTSGLADYHDDEDEASWDACWERLPTYRVRQPADLLPLFAGLPTVAAPGEEYRYCDANFVLVGLVVEAATGRSYADVVAEGVFGRAGMIDTRIEALDEDPERLAVGYRMDEGPFERWRTNAYSVPVGGMPDGGMISTPADLVRMVDALLAGRLLSPELVAAMTRPQGPAPATAAEAYGYGCELGLIDDRVAVFGHGGSDPGVSARLSHFVDAAMTIAVICNQDRGSWAAALRIVDALGLVEPRR